MEGLEEKLIQDKWLTPEQLVLAAGEAKRLGKSIWVALVKLGILSEEDIAIFFAQRVGIPYVRITDYQISDEVIHLLDEDFCRENLVLPLFKIRNTLFVVCVNPLDTTVIDRLRRRTGFDIEPLIANSCSITQAQDYYYGLKQEVFDLERFILEQRSVRSLPFYRASERIALNLVVRLCVEDKGLILHYSSAIEGITQDISSDGTCMGLSVFLFIPRGTVVSLEFIGVGIKLKGEIIYCRMSKGLRYFLGVRFVEVEDRTRRELLKLTGQKK